MKILTIENDHELESVSKRYLHKLPAQILPESITIETIITDANNVDTEVLMEAFKTHDILIFKPTEITYGQYNTLLMAMYKLLTTKELGLKELHVIYYDTEDLESELKALWKDKRKYLDQVLVHVKIYRVYPGDEKIEIHI